MNIGVLKSTLHMLLEMVNVHLVIGDLMMEYIVV